jgi:GTP-binding protein
VDVSSIENISKAGSWHSGKSGKSMRNRPEDLKADIPIIRVSACDGPNSTRCAVLEHLALDRVLRQPPLLNDLLPKKGLLVMCAY